MIDKIYPWICLFDTLCDLSGCLGVPPSPSHCSSVTLWDNKLQAPLLCHDWDCSYSASQWLLCTVTVQLSVRTEHWLDHNYRQNSTVYVTPSHTPQALLVFKLSFSLKLFFNFELQFVLCGGHWVQVSLYCGLYRLGHALSVVPAHCTAWQTTNMILSPAV